MAVDGAGSVEAGGTGGVSVFVSAGGAGVGAAGGVSPLASPFSSLASLLSS